MTRVAEALKDNEGHFNNFRTILYNQRFLPAGECSLLWEHQDV